MVCRRATAATQTVSRAWPPISKLHWVTVGTRFKTLLYPGKSNGIGVSKEGFEDPLAGPDGPEDPNALEGHRRVTINGDTRYDIQLVRRYPEGAAHRTSPDETAEKCPRDVSHVKEVAGARWG